MNKKLLVIIMACMLTLLTVGIASAAEWDNVKSYDEETRTITIKNTFGLPLIGNDIAKVKLLSNLKVVVPPTYTNVSMFEMISYSDYTDFISQIEYFNIRDNMKEVDKNVDIKYWGNVIVDDNIQRCISSTHSNGTKYDTGCYDEKVGAAKNHIIDGKVGEFTFDELKTLIEKYFVIEKTYGTFASQRDYKPLMNEWQTKMYNALNDYYDVNLLSNLMAPLFPEHSRNCLWRCKLKLELCKECDEIKDSDYCECNEE